MDEKRASVEESGTEETELLVAIEICHHKIRNFIDVARGTHVDFNCKPFEY